MVQTYTVKVKSGDCRNMDKQKYIDQYLDWKASFAPRASVVYRVYLERFAKFVGSRELSQISLADILKFQASESKGHKQSTVAYEMIVVRNFLQFWKRQGTDCIDPAIMRIPRYVAKAHEAITVEEYGKLRAVSGVHDFVSLSRSLCLALLWDTGVRVSELCDLDLCDIDLQARNARVITKKSLVVRWIFWTEETHELLTKYIGTRICLNQGAALMVAPSGGKRERISTRTVQRWIVELCKLAGVTRKITPHSFRHAKAHQILKRGGSVADIAKILGHSDKNPSAAFNYLKIDKGELTERAKLYL